MNKGVVCTANQVDYITIRKGMVEGARTKEELMESVGLCGECEGCQSDLNEILEMVCTCRQVSLKTIVDAVLDGASTIEEVGAKTGAGTACTRCQALVGSVIEFKR